MIYAADIHYLAADGTYHEIDNNLIADKDGSGHSVYRVTENPAMYCYGAENAPYVMSVQCRGRTLRWRFPEDVRYGSPVVQEPAVINGIDIYKQWESEKERSEQEKREVIRDCDKPY